MLLTSIYYGDLTWWVGGHHLLLVWRGQSSRQHVIPRGFMLYSVYLSWFLEKLSPLHNSSVVNRS